MTVEQPTAIRTATAGETVIGIGQTANVNSADDENTGRLSGRVTDEEGNPIMDTTVAVNGTDRKTTPASDGYYNLKLPEGTHEIVVSADGFHRETATVNVTSTQWATFDVTLSVATAKALGTVRDETNDPIENATIAIRSIGAETVTGPDGAYEIVVPRGRHTLEVNATGYYIRRAVIETENRGSIEQNVTLVPKRNGSPNETANRSTANETPVTSVTNNVTDDDSDSRAPASERSSVRFRVIDLLLFAVLFLGALASATLVGLYRNRSDRL